MGAAFFEGSNKKLREMGKVEGDTAVGDSEI